MQLKKFPKEEGPETNIGKEKRQESKETSWKKRKEQERTWKKEEIVQKNERIKSVGKVKEGACLKREGRDKWGSIEASEKSGMLQK